ncbi:MAG: signal peptide peptidase SppA, type [Bacillales bacterium]|jgi:protease-4|nr:signal peptide peptidase SppA, type [Bacillales bacterium]
MDKKRWFAIIIAIALLGFSLITNTIIPKEIEEANSLLDSSLFADMDGFEEVIVEDGNQEDKIAIFELNGVIQDVEDTGTMFSDVGYNHKVFLNMLDYAKNDATVKGIILKVNSPGGGVYESAQIHKKLLEIKNEAKIPVYVSMGSMAASGGYYISAPADKIFASPETITGSLGVIMQSLNVTGLAKKYGVTYDTIKSGQYKDIMNPVREMTKEERDILQSMVQNSYNNFVDVIAEGRGLDKNEVRKIADGRIYDGIQAEKIKLVDKLGYEEDAIKDMRKKYKLSDAQVIKYETPFNFSSFFQTKIRSMFTKDDELSLLNSLLKKSNSPTMMYLYTK